MRLPKRKKNTQVSYYCIYKHSVGRDRNLAVGTTGYHAGYAQGRADQLNGSPRNNHCSASNSDNFCSGYTIGYEVGYTKSALIH